MVCIENRKQAYCESSAKARGCRDELFLFENLILLVVVMSQVFQLFTRPNLVLLAIGTAPCAFLRKRPLTAFLLACTSFTIYLVSRNSFFDIFTRKTPKDFLRRSKSKKPRRNSRHHCAPQSTVVDLLGEELSNAGAEVSAKDVLGSRNQSMETNPQMYERIYSPYSYRESYKQATDACSSKESETGFSRRGRSQTQDLYCVRGDVGSNVDIGHEIEVADSMMGAMLSAFQDT